jgi:C-terminal processing protease CtpA/Prc
MLGTSQWLTANGRLIRKHGIEPDEVVKVPIEADLISPLAVKTLSADELLKSEDTQLLKALELLGAIPETDTDQVKTTEQK